METILGLIVTALCTWGCYSLAEKQGRNKTLAVVMGILFSWISLIVYVVMGDKKKD